VLLGFRREVDANCTLLGYHKEIGGNFSPTFRENLSIPSSGVNNPEDGTVTLSRNVGKK
jgi:pyocin large subunit-like protein